MSKIDIPSDFNAVVFTALPTLTKDTLPAFIGQVEKSGIQDSSGNRILHFHQVEDIDSSAIAGLVNLSALVKARGDNLVICDPPPVFRSLVKLYGLIDTFKDIIIGSSKDGSYKSSSLPFVPPFVPEPNGRVDVYTNGKVKSFRIGKKHLEEMSPVDLNNHPPKAPARAKTMMVESSNEQQKLDSKAYVMLRNHACGCDHTHAIFESIYNLHNWYRNKGFDFVDLKLWASDEPAGYIVEEVTFRDRQHHGQFNIMLKIDESWKKLLLKEEYVSDQFYYVY